MKHKLYILITIPTLILALSLGSFIYFITLDDFNREIERLTDEVIVRTWDLGYEYREHSLGRHSRWEEHHERLLVLLQRVESIDPTEDNLIQSMYSNLNKLDILIPDAEIPRNIDYEDDVLSLLNEIVHAAGEINEAKSLRVDQVKRRIKGILYFVMPLLLLVKVCVMLITFRSIHQDVMALRIAHKKLEDINEDLKRFASFISHDLRDPIRMVGSYLRLLKDKYSYKIDDEADEFIDFALEGCKRSEELIDSLLSCARLDSGIVFKDCNFKKDVIDIAIKNLEVAIRETGTEILLRCPEDLILRCDPIRMTQVFQNLISNGIKYNKNIPEISITVFTKDSTVVCCIQDNGIGISNEDVNKLFQIFKRLHPRSEYPGTGIGLAICRKIIEQHDGTIWVESEIGKGSKFYFTIPFKQLVVSFS